MKNDSIAAMVVAGAGVTWLTALVCLRFLDSTHFVLAVSVLSVVCLALRGFSRLTQLDLKGIKLTLAEMKQVKAEIEQLYSGIDHLRRTPFVLDRERMHELGLNPGGFPSSPGGVMRYVAGCVKRERERLARIFVAERTPETVARAILDDSLDENVFKWTGPESPLDETPIPLPHGSFGSGTPPAKAG